MDLKDPGLLINRELSWLAFNERVLEQARDSSLPILERLRFFGIFSSNLDEYFMIHVAGLRRRMLAGDEARSQDGLTAAQQFQAVSERIHAGTKRWDQVWREDLLLRLEASGLSIFDPRTAGPGPRSTAHQHFASTVLQALTPAIVAPGRPLPDLTDLTLYVAVLFSPGGPGERRSLGLVQVPPTLPRLIGMQDRFVFVEHLVAAFAAELFRRRVDHATAFRVTRDRDLDLDTVDVGDLPSLIGEESWRRPERAPAVRLEIEPSTPPEVAEALTRALGVSAPDLYQPSGPLQGADLTTWAARLPRPELRVRPYVPVIPPEAERAESIFQLLDRGDLLLHHPYESFEPVVRFIEEASRDPDVVSIEQTLYRTGDDPRIPRALSRAAERGKAVTVVVELKARLDEATNVALARKLAESGVRVTNGLTGLKVHCKLTVVSRREGSAIRRYAHLGTGNYNPETARIYTDLSYLTAQQPLAEDVSSVFGSLTGRVPFPRWNKIVASPLQLRHRLVERIDQEALRGEGGRIRAKMNALQDPEVIQALYRASQSGVEVSLLVRGICCLRPGVEGASERITVVSVVDTFLEHGRIYEFGAGEQAEVYVSSADWMPRNFLTRVEVMFPVEEAALKARLGHVLDAGLGDDVSAHQLQPDGSYRRRTPRDGASPRRSQYELIALVGGEAPA